MIQDLSFALRQLRKNPGFAVLSILLVTLGIGSTTAIFTVVYAVVLRPLPFPDSGRLVALWTQTPQVDRLPMAAANHRDLQAQATVFEEIAIFRGTASYNLSGDGEPERLLAARVPANLFPLLRVKPLLGRGFTEDENQPNQDRVVILSYGLWQRRYAGDPGIVGKSIQLENVPHAVVGVMEADFQYPSRDVQIWTPLTINPADFQTRTGYAHLAVGRLKAGVSLEQAQSELDLIAARLAVRYPGPNKDVKFRVVPLRDDVSGVARRPLVVLLGAAVGLLLIGCCNLANLLLARALTRSRETAVRSALGATPYRLARQGAAEILPILALGSFLGVLGAMWGIGFMKPWLPAALPRLDEVRVSLPVLMFSGALLIVMAAPAALWPSTQTLRADLVTSLRECSRTSSSTKGGTTLRNLLVVGQVAVTFVLLTGAGLLIRSFAELKDLQLGFRPQGALSFQLAIPRNKYGEDKQVAAFCHRLLESVRALPGIEAAGMSNRLPLSEASGLSSVEFERAGQNPGILEATDETSTTPGYFDAMGIPVLQGRSFSDRDTAQGPMHAVVDDRVAAAAWPGENPIGKRIRSGPVAPWGEVVGVVAHIRHESLESDRRLQIYWSHLQRARDRMSLVVRTSGEPQLLINPVLRAIRAVDPDQPAFAVRPMTEVVDRTLALRWFNTVMISVFASASLLLAMVGIYGVMAWTMRQRSREIAVRLALGAQRHAVFSLVLRNGFKLAGAGLALGCLGGMALSHVLRSLLFGIGPNDPFTFATVPLVLACVVLLASWLPARRAMRVDPVEALRGE